MSCIYKLWSKLKCCLQDQCKCVKLNKPRPSPANPNPKIEANPFKYIL